MGFVPPVPPHQVKATFRCSLCENLYPLSWQSGLLYRQKSICLKCSEKINVNYNIETIYDAYFNSNKNKPIETKEEPTNPRKYERTIDDG